MEYRPLGGTGVKVSKICLGSMMFGEWGNPDHGESTRIIHAALDAGVNFVDTADMYSGGESEEIVGKAIAGRRDDVVVATKFFNRMGRGPNRQGSSRRWIVQACEDSLRRLGTDYIDLYQLHRYEPRTDLDETLGALSDLVRQGKVRYIGTSKLPASRIVESQWVSERRSLERFVCEQPPYSLLNRGIEAEVLPTCRALGVGQIVFSPLAQGVLTGKYDAGGPPPGSRGADEKRNKFMAPYLTSESLTKARRLGALARERGTTSARLALAWLLAQPGVDAVIAGATRPEQVRENAAASDVAWDASLAASIDAIFRG
jgi:aryl-alcohol dehydrogenase-like predicted oxidoreductase